MVPEILPSELRCGLTDLRWKIADVYLHYAHYRQLFAQVVNQGKNEFRLPVITSKYLALYEDILALVVPRLTAA